MQLDLLAFGAHPDDVELGCSGTLIKLVKQGYKIGVVSLTRGEMGSRGDAAIRQEEFDEASGIIGLSFHQSLDIADSDIQITMENKLKLIKILRQLRPALVCAPYWRVRHPDHGNCSKLVKEASYFSGLQKIETKQNVHRPNRILYYPTRYDFEPSFIVDISLEFDQKIAALQAYKSQFSTDKISFIGEQSATISTAEFMDIITTKAQYWGDKIGVKYGEPFLVTDPLRINDPVAFFKNSYTI